MNEIITKQAPPPMPPINIGVLCFDMKLLEFPEMAGTGAESEGGEADGVGAEGGLELFDGGEGAGVCGDETE